MKNHQNNKIEIRIPEGCFCANGCNDCRYADWNKRDKYNRIVCRHSNIAGWVDPDDRWGCWNYVWEKA